MYRKCRDGSHKAKKKSTYASEYVGDEKNLHPGGRKLFFFSSIQLNFLNKVYTYRSTQHYYTALFFAEKQRVLSFIVRREKIDIRLNKLANGKMAQRRIVRTKHFPLWI